MMRSTSIPDPKSRLWSIGPAVCLVAARWIEASAAFDLSQESSSSSEMVLCGRTLLDAEVGEQTLLVNRETSRMLQRS
jgi:hypothetical protein